MNKELIERICKLNCSLKELEVIKIEDIQTDSKNAFDKYYRLDIIKQVVHKYNEKEISFEYLSYWVNAYKFIINGSFSRDVLIENEVVRLIRFEIFDILDELSYTDENDLENQSLTMYLNRLEALDFILKSYSDFKVTYALLENSYIDILFVNPQKKEYLLLNHKHVDDSLLLCGIQKLAHQEMKQYKQDLIQAKYKEL